MTQCSPDSAFSELLATCKAIERHCQAIDTHGNPIAHTIEGKHLRARMKEAIAACERAPAQAAQGDPVAWRYCHKGQGDWCMLKDGQDPTKWLATFNGEYEIQPLYAAQPQAAPMPTDEWCNAFLKASGQWVDPHEPATECGVEVECGISQDDADSFNAEGRNEIRRAYEVASNGRHDVPQAANAKIYFGTDANALIARAEDYLAHNAAESGADELIRELVQTLRAQPQGAWLPIETAPKDERIDLWVRSPRTGATMRIPDALWDETLDDWQCWHAGKWLNQIEYQATHWMPLPADPLSRLDEPQAAPVSELIARAQQYLDLNAAESGADVLIAELIKALSRPKQG